MPLTHDEQKLENSKAHLQKILGDISIANKALETIFAEKDGAQASLDRIRESVVTESAELNRLLQLRVDVQVGMQNKEADLAKRESALIAEKATFEKYKEAELLAIKQEEARVLGSLESTRNLIRELRENEDLTIARINILREEVKELETVIKEIADLKKEKSQLSQEVDDLRASNKEDMDEMERELAEKRSDLLDAQKAVAEAWAAVDGPRKKVAIEEQALAQKVRNFKILKERLEKHFKMLLPDLSLANQGLD